MAKHRIEWFDLHREPQDPPNPDYPDGIAVDLRGEAQRWCEVPLDYPARRVGLYRIECAACGLAIMLTTAGRRDDPRSVKMACKPLPGLH